MPERANGALRLGAAIGLTATLTAGIIWPTPAQSRDAASDMERARQLTKIIRSWYPSFPNHRRPDNYCAIRREARDLIDTLERDDAYQYRTSSLAKAADRLADAEEDEHSYWWDDEPDDYGEYWNYDPCDEPDSYFVGFGDFQPQAVVSALFSGRPAAFDWSGFYVGLNGGWASGSSRWDFPDGTTGSFPANGALFGGTAGFNWQNGRLVTGVEATIDWGRITGSSDFSCAAGCRTSNSWTGMVDGRIGVSTGAFLPFVAAGITVGNVNQEIVGVSGSNDLRAGWNVSAGAEYKLTPDWSARAQYYFVDYGNGSCGTACGGAKVPLHENFVLFSVNRALKLGN